MWGYCGCDCNAFCKSMRSKLTLLPSWNCVEMVRTSVKVVRWDVVLQLCTEQHWSFESVEGEKRVWKEISRIINCILYISVSSVWGAWWSFVFIMYVFKANHWYGHHVVWCFPLIIGEWKLVNLEQRVGRAKGYRRLPFSCNLADPTGHSMCLQEKTFSGELCHF